MQLNLTIRQSLIVVHDALATALALGLAFGMRFEGDLLVEKARILQFFLPAFVFYAATVYFLVGLHRNKWRFSSVLDLSSIVRASTILAVSLLALDYLLLSPQLYGTFLFGKITILLYWFLQIALLGGARAAYRYYHYARTLQRTKQSDANPILIVGRAEDAEVLLRSVESGAVRGVWPAGILSPSRTDQGHVIRGVKIVGDLNDLESVIGDLNEQGTRIARLLLTPSGLSEDARPESILVRARKLGLSVSKLPALDTQSVPVQLQPVSVEDLLLRPSVQIDYKKLETLISGKAVVVTGGGGSIGSEICRRVVAFGGARLLILDHSEAALHSVLEEICSAERSTEVSGRIADIRDRARLMRLIEVFRPDLVFHAAALKHVPLLERDWDEGIRTNVFGSVNVADAAVSAGAAAMVMISTDKAIEPVSVLGATKRAAEMYCDALDRDLSAASAESRSLKTRLISVRFGNVLASNGSVVPKFKSQIESGGPVTVTHPEMVRYFMTIREACDLVMTSAMHALSSQSKEVSVYVLNMGQPVRIVDLAERMIRLSGLEPGEDVAIEFTGMRPGERLHEILFARDEASSDIGVPGIVAAKPIHASLALMQGWLQRLEQALASGDALAIHDLLRAAVPEFNGRT